MRHTSLHVVPILLMWSLTDLEEPGKEAIKLPPYVPTVGWLKERLVQ